ncbi:hypothetical protein GCM10027076_15740 [Nocardioides montaniterrae]
MRAALACLLAVLGLALVAPTAHAAPAPNRCTVLLGHPDQVAKAATGASAVFAAKVTKAAPGAANHKLTNLQVQVLAGFKGPVRKGGTAAVQVSGTGKRPAAGATYLFFAKRHGKGLSADLCGHVVKLAKGLTQQLSAKLKADLSGGAQAATVRLSPPNPDVRDLPALSRLVAPGLGVALFGLLGLLLFRRLGREKS